MWKRLPVGEAGRMALLSQSLGPNADSALRAVMGHRGVPSLANDVTVYFSLWYCKDKKGGVCGMSSM